MKPIPFNQGTKPWRVILPPRFSPEHKRITKYFANKPDAEAFCRKVEKYGFVAGSEPVVSKVQHDQFSVAVSHLSKLFDGDVSKLYQVAERIKKLKDVKPATVREAIELFQAWRQKRADAGELSLSTVRTDFDRLNKLIKEFEAVQLVEITPVALREFFEEVDGNPQSIYKSTSVFFGWALDHGYLGENPMAVVKSTGSYGVNNEYYPVDTFRRMLRIAAGLDPIKTGGKPTKELIGMLPYFVVGGFLGLRRHEALRMTRAADALRWTDLHLDAEVPNVEVREDVAKVHIRWIETAHYLEAFKAWLPFIAETKPHIVPWTHSKMQKLKAEFTRQTKIEFIENGFRNSFATYALTYNGLQGVGKLSLEMGNSERICKRHYIKNIAPGSGKAWFNLRPFEVVPANAKQA